MRAHYLLLVMLIFTGALASAGDIVRIQLKDAVEVNGIEFKLGDISYIETSDMQLKNDLTNAVIGRSPLVGYKGRFSRASIQSRISHLFPQLGSKAHWNGSDEVAVKALGFRLKKEKYIRGAKKYLEQQIEGNFEQVNIEVDGLYKDINLPKGELEINYHTNNPQNLRKRMQVWADIAIDGRKVVSQPVWLKVNAIGQAWVVRNDVTAGSLINRGMFERKKLDIAAVGRRVISELPECCLKRIRKTMSVGDVLVEENIELAPAIARGVVVEVVATAENVRISTQAISLQDGDIGDVVKVRQGSEGVVYHAKVIGRNMLTVDGVKK